MSLWASYYSEREGYQTLETDHGFAIYKIFNEIVYLRDIYVSPDYRKTGLAKDMANEVSAIAKAQGCKILRGTVDTRANNATQSIKVLLAYGMHVVPSNEILVFEKEI